MKKIGAFLVGVGLLAGITVAADSNTATSVNAVGFETFSVPANKSILLRIDFDKIDKTAWTVNDLFGTNFTHDVTVFYWGTTSWLSENFDSVFKEWDPGTTPFYRGDALFVKMKGPAGLTNVIVIAGEVPSASSTTNTLNAGMSTVGYAYPVAMPITNTTLSAAAAGSQMTVFYWNQNAGTWGGVNWDPVFQEWDPTEYVFQPGQGYFIRKYAAGVTNWIEPKTYNLN